MARIVVTVMMVASIGLIALGNATAPAHVIGQGDIGIGIPWSVEQYTNLTALTILGAMSLFIVCKMLPALHKQMMDQNKEYVLGAQERTRIFSETIQRQNESLSRTMALQAESFAKTISDAHDELREHTKAVSELREHCIERFGPAYRQVHKEQ